MPQHRSDSGVPADRATPKFDPAERTQRARLAAHLLHAQRDPQEITAAARSTFDARFERQVDPDGVLDPAERQRRAAHARAAYFARLSRAGVKARRRKARGGEAA